MTPGRKRRACELAAGGMTRTEVAGAIQVARGTLWRAAQEDRAFGRAFAEAEERGIDAIEDVLQSSLRQVRDDPRYGALAMWWLQNRRPERWQNVSKIDERRTVRVDLEGMDESELRRLAHAGGVDGDLPPSRRVRAQAPGTVEVQADDAEDGEPGS